MSLDALAGVVGALLLLAAVLTTAMIVLARVGRARWAVTTRALMLQLDAQRAPIRPTHFDARELEGLPAPVQRYLRLVLKDGQPMIAAVTLTHAGSFNLSPDGARWRPFTSEQRVVVQRAGFVWNGHVRAGPGVVVHVHDAYLAGEGLLHPSLMGWISLADQRSGGELARGELARFVAESAWYPTVLLPSQGTQWTAVDDRSADATITDGASRVTMRFRFNAAGLVDAARIEARGATVGHTLVMTPWEGVWSNWKERDGIRVPLSGEAVWLPTQGRRPYWRGQVTSIAFEFAA